ncbi:MAG: hypothetical protein OXN89_06205 [Bryobacterales bacterium]|nr:hypothetical protein [Bryobacterales bacterium]
MRRHLPLILVIGGAAGLWAGPDGSAPKFSERTEEPAVMVDEDEEFAPPQQEYAFNPVQARNELKVGNFYAKKGSHRAAALRYLEATRWDSGLAEAFRRLGMVREKLSEHEAAASAYRRFLEIEPDGKAARQVRQRLAAVERAARAPTARAGAEGP